MRHLAASACFCLAFLLMATSAFHAPAAHAAQPAHPAPAASAPDPDDAADDAADDDESDAADDAAGQQLGNCATLGEAVRRFALARDKGLAKMDAFKDVTRGKSAYVAGSLLDQTLAWPYDHPAEQPITTASHFYHRCVLDALDSLNPATEDELNKRSLSCQQQNAADPDAIDDCIGATTDAIVDRYHGNAPPAVTRTPASAFTPFAFIAETPLIAAAPRPGARARPVAAPPKAVTPLEATPAVASTPVFAQPQAAPLLAASASSPAASVAQVAAPPVPPLEETPASASAVMFTQSEAAPLLAAVPSPAAAVPAPVAAPTVPLEETPATASAPAYTQPESASLLAATTAPVVSPPVEVAPPPAPVMPQPAPQQVAVAAPAPAPVAAVVAVATPPVEVAAPAPAARATREMAVAGTGPAGIVEYGQLKLGMPLAEAIKTFHSYPEIEKDEQGADSYVFLVADGNAFVTLRTSPTHPGELYGIQVTGGPEAKQAPVVGVLLGDTASDLLAKVGQPTARTPVKDYHTLWSYTGRNYSFEVSDGGDVISLLIYGYAGTPEEESLDQDGGQGHTGDGGF